MVDFQELKNILCRYYNSVSDKTIDKIAQHFEYRNYKKGDTVVSNKSICTQCFFICSGYTRGYIYREDAQFTLWFGEPGDMITSFSTMFQNEKGNEIIETLTDCTMLAINMQTFKKLISEEIEIANVYHKIVEAGYLFWERRFLIYSQERAEDRYKEWYNRSKHISEHISLGVIAQYLNIDQATLSRIRSKIKK